MNLHLHFILINSEFNQGIADDLYEGQESEDNINKEPCIFYYICSVFDVYSIKN